MYVMHVTKCNDFYTAVLLKTVGQIIIIFGSNLYEKDMVESVTEFIFLKITSVTRDALICSVPVATVSPATMSMFSACTVHASGRC
jgi:hypothetical protein